jgi:thiamine biosynthesis lipoprotein
VITDPLPEAWTFEAIGTGWRIDTAEPIEDAVRARVANRIARFDRDWSRFRDDSLVTRIAREPGRHRLPDDAPPLLALYRELYEATSGRVSPLVGRALESLGYDASYRLTPAAVPERVPAWDDAIAWDGTYFSTASPVLLDVGAAGKGYLVDLVSELLSEAGIRQYVVDASGDLVTRGVPLRVALEHPADPSKAIGVVELGVRGDDGAGAGAGAGGSRSAICASATNRRAWGVGLHHVLDAVTGLPTADVVATWAIAPTALWADGAATALFFDTAPGFFESHDIVTVRLFATGRVEHSATFTGELFL